LHSTDCQLLIGFYKIDKFSVKWAIIVAGVFKLFGLERGAPK